MMTVGRITQLAANQGPLPKITPLPPVRSEPLLAAVLTAWKNGVERWQENHESYPTAFSELAHVMDDVQAHIGASNGVALKARQKGVEWKLYMCTPTFAGVVYVQNLKTGRRKKLTVSGDTSLPFVCVSYSFDGVPSSACYELTDDSAAIRRRMAQRL